VCRLQLLLVLASGVIFGSDPRCTHDHILLSQIRDSPNLEGQAPVFISPRNRVAQLYPQALGSFPSPARTRRATVEVLEPTSTGGGDDQSNECTQKYVSLLFPAADLI
jgi:hypothetical protein